MSASAGVAALLNLPKVRTSATMLTSRERRKHVDSHVSSLGGSAVALQMVFYPHHKCHSLHSRCLSTFLLCSLSFHLCFPSLNSAPLPPQEGKCHLQYPLLLCATYTHARGMLILQKKTIKCSAHPADPCTLETHTHLDLCQFGATLTELSGSIRS